MYPKDVSTWLPSALLLLRIPGCFLLSGPSTVTGTEGGSLSMQCQYEEGDKAHNKYLCRKLLVVRISLCDKTVKTKASVREARSGRVTIRDHPANLSFTVTLESLTLQDAGSYRCGVDRPWQQDPTSQVVVTVFPAPTTATNHEQTKSTLGPSMTKEVTSSPSPPPRSLLFSVLVLLLVFLKVPLFLSMLGAVLWVNRPRRSSAQRWSWPD